MKLPPALKNPLTMVGTLDRCWLFTYRTPVEAARAHLPAELEPVLHGGMPFWNVVVCHVHKMRPKYAPAAVGVSYWHVAYRLYVRLQPSGGAPVEGLYFIRSDCDNTLMSAAGNLLTDFSFHTAPVTVRDSGEAVDITVGAPDAPAHVRIDRSARPELAPGSSFSTVDEAAIALKYKPFGISVDGGAGVANVVRIVREEAAWRSTPVAVTRADLAFFRDKPVEPEVAVEVAPIFYQWNRGMVVPLRVPHSADAPVTSVSVG